MTRDERERAIDVISEIARPPILCGSCRSVRSVVSSGRRLGRTGRRSALEAGRLQADSRCSFVLVPLNVHEQHATKCSTHDAMRWQQLGTIRRPSVAQTAGSETRRSKHGGSVAQTAGLEIRAEEEARCWVAEAEGSPGNAARALESGAFQWNF